MPPGRAQLPSAQECETGVGTPHCESRLSATPRCYLLPRPWPVLAMFHPGL